MSFIKQGKGKIQESFELKKSDTKEAKKVEKPKEKANA